jgi:hypothetical protein
MLLIELTTFEIRTKSMLDRWKKFADSYRARGQDPTVVVFNKWFTDNFRGQGRTVTPNLGAISDLKDSSVSQYLGKALSYYDTGELWQDQAPEIKPKPVTRPRNTLAPQPAPAPQTTVTQPSAAPEPATQSVPAASTEKQIEMPGTNIRYTAQQAWKDASGNFAPAAVASVLDKLASGKSASEIGVSELMAARRSLGLAESKTNKKLRESRNK